MADTSEAARSLVDDDDDDNNNNNNSHGAAITQLDHQKRQDFIHRMNQVHVGGHQADASSDADRQPSDDTPPISDDPHHHSSDQRDHSSERPSGEASVDGVPRDASVSSSKPLVSNDASQTNKPPQQIQIQQQQVATEQRVGPFPKYRDDRVLTAVSVPPSEQFPVKDEMIGPHHFKRLRLLGRGGIGQVYLVRLKDTEKLYAMKVLTKEEMIQRNKVKRVMTEREILATANHPFIVTMYASFQTSDRLCFVMEYCEGGEFFRVLQRQPKKRLKEDAVKFYAAEVILALEYLHHMGFIYRDLKPENILMRATGHIALTDFDLSKQAHAVSPRVIQQALSFSDKLKKTLSLSMKKNNSLNGLEIVNSEPVLPYQTNSFVGTEEYIAPEVVNGVGQSSAVDWWTLGILIYEMLTGTTPFKGSYTDETFNNIVHEQLKWPDDINVSNECKQLVKKLLRREADKRLGAENGASDIKRSKWFKDFNFALIRNETPPIIPKRDPKDLQKYADHDDDEQYSPAGLSSTYQEEKNPENPFSNFYIRK